MGNKVCCEDTRTHAVLEKQDLQKKQVDRHPIQTKPASEIKQQSTPKTSTPEPLRIPPLAPKVSEKLKAQKFFEKQLHNQTRAEIRKYGGDVYEGCLDEKKERPHGFGRMYKQDKSHYIGHFNHGKAEGQGVFIFPDGSYYSGLFHNNKAESTIGQFFSNTIRYRGGFSNNLFQGKGSERGINYVFQGSFRNGSRVRGLLKWDSQNPSYSYEGEFNYYNQFHGKGTTLQHRGVLKQAQGTYEGQFSNGQKHGYGVYKALNESKYEGNYVNGVREGRGAFYQKDGSELYSGQIKNGLPHGKGRAPGADGKLIEGEWVNGIEKSLLAR